GDPGRVAPSLRTELGEEIANGRPKLPRPVFGCRRPRRELDLGWRRGVGSAHPRKLSADDERCLRVTGVPLERGLRIDERAVMPPDARSHAGATRAQVLPPR